MVRDSQQDALNKAEKLAAEIDDPKLHALAGSATQLYEGRRCDRCCTSGRSIPRLAARGAARTRRPRMTRKALKLAEHEFRVTQ